MYFEDEFRLMCLVHGFCSGDLPASTPVLGNEEELVSSVGSHVAFSPLFRECGSSTLEDLFGYSHVQA